MTSPTRRDVARRVDRLEPDDSEGYSLTEFFWADLVAAYDAPPRGMAHVLADPERHLSAEAYEALAHADEAEDSR
jgi:hypothetical protein